MTMPGKRDDVGKELEIVVDERQQQHGRQRRSMLESALHDTPQLKQRRGTEQHADGRLDQRIANRDGLTASCDSFPPEH